MDIYVFPLLLLNGLLSLEFRENNILYTINKNQVALNEYQDYNKIYSEASTPTFEYINTYIAISIHIPNEIFIT